MERRTACEPLQLMMLPVEVLHTVLSSDLLDLPGLLRCRQVSPNNSLKRCITCLICSFLRSVGSCALS